MLEVKTGTTESLCEEQRSRSRMTGQREANFNATEQDFRWFMWELFRTDFCWYLNLCRGIKCVKGHSLEAKNSFLPFHHLCREVWRRPGTHRTCGRGWRARAALWDTASAERLLYAHLCYCREEMEKGWGYYLWCLQGTEANTSHDEYSWSRRTVEDCITLCLFNILKKV